MKTPMRENHLIVKKLTVAGQEVTGGIILAADQSVDLNGIADSLVLDADTDTTISAPTDDQIDIELKSVDHVVIKAVATADSGATTNIVEIAASTPVDTTGTNEHNALNIDLEIGNATGGTNTVNAIKIDNITGDAQVVETGILLGTGFDVGLDMQGTKIDLDAAGTTSIIASTDNTIDIEVNGANDFQITANTLTALSGSTIATNTIAETTAASGVTIDGLLIKDGITGTLQAITGDGAITIQNASVFLSKGSAAAITLAAPTATTHDGFMIRVVAISAQAHVITGSVDGFNAKGASGTATFGGALGDSVTFVAYQGHWYTLSKVNVTIA